MSVSITDQIKSIGRELGMRKAAYPGMVARQKIDQSTADREIAAMDAAYATLKWVEKRRARLLDLAPELAGDDPNGGAA